MALSQEPLQANRLLRVVQPSPSPGRESNHTNGIYASLHRSQHVVLRENAPRATIRANAGEQLRFALPHRGRRVYIFISRAVSKINFEKGVFEARHYPIIKGLSDQIPSCAQAPEGSCPGTRQTLGRIAQVHQEANLCEACCVVD